MVKLSYREGSDVEPGEYEAIVGKVTIKTSREGGDFLAWPFWIGGDGEGKWVDASSSMSTSTRSKAYGWIKAIVGNAPINEEIDLDVLEGLPCRIIVEINPEGWPKVAAVLPPPRQAQAAPSAPVQAAQPAQEAPTPTATTPAAATSPVRRPPPVKRQAPALEPF